MQKSTGATRREFLNKAVGTAIAAPFFVRNLISAPPSDIVRLGAFGASGMAYTNIQQLARHPKVKLVCVAEVDSSRLSQLKALPLEGYQIHEDWRKMLDKEAKNLDAVCVGTPDHMHAQNVMGSMLRGLHVYGQKPLAHDVHEVRQLAKIAQKKHLVTQMGIQIHSRAEYKNAVTLVQTGAIGKIKEVHSWSEKKWGDPEPMPDRSDPVPSTFNWDLWLGVAEKRPFLGDEYYHPGNWRKRTDFGTATFGDMGCHILDPVCSALKLTAPLSVRSEGPAPSKHSWAVNTLIRYVFPATPYTEEKTVGVTWYDGDQRPPREVLELVGLKPLPGQGSIFVGTKGAMLLPHIGEPALFPEAHFKDFEQPKAESVNHYFEFIDAVLGKGTTSTPFSYSGPLTEWVLLGPIATRFPKTTLQWNAAKQKFRNSPEATQHVRRHYRSGWSMKELG
ncbi:MAG: Gfo/Idh/MocA family oxidoreductase [Bryobacteraceae bacterium]|nr:Gfo/Idh/MocA family oxidoreductase [Bryobacteraceae bacterium]